MFAALAGVRGEGPELKGLPSDVTQTIQDESDRWDGDGHSHSYDSIEDFEYKLFELDRSKENTLTAPKAFFSEVGKYDEWNQMNWYTLIAYCKEKVTKLKLELEAESMLLDQPINTDVECRLVYWFDN